MSGGFFRGTSADQDTRFSNKNAKLLKSQKFAPELDHLVDMRKVKMDVIRPWIANRVTELLGFEDEVLINFIYGLLDAQEVNGKLVQIQLTGFMEKNTGKFMKELWMLLLSAQKNESGVPQQFLDAKEEETRKKQAEVDRIANEIQKKQDKEKESRELELERSKKMDVEAEKKANSSMEPASKHMLPKGSTGRDDDEKETDARNGVRGRNRVSRSPHLTDRSLSPPRGSSSRISKPISNSRSHPGLKSRSASRSPESRGRCSTSFERESRSPKRPSVTPRRRHSPKDSSSPPRRRSSDSRRRSRSPQQRRSPSPIRRRLHSPSRCGTLSPLHDRSLSPVRRRRSPSPVRRRRSPSPLRRRRSPSPVRRRRSPSPVRRRRSPSPARHRRSPSPARHRRSPSPARHRRSSSPVRRRSPSLLWHRSPLPLQHRSRSPIRRRSPPSSRRRSPSPLNRRYQRSPSSPRRRSPSPLRHRSPLMSRKRSPAPRCRSPSPYGSSSPSPVKRGSISPLRSPKEHKRSPMHSSGERVRLQEKSPVPHRSSSYLRSPRRDQKDRKELRNKLPNLSPSSERSSLRSGSPPVAKNRSPSEDRSPSASESPVRQRKGRIIHDDSLSPQKQRERRPCYESPETSEEHREIGHTREDGNYNSRSSQKRPMHSSSIDKQKDSPAKVHYKDEQSPERLASRRSADSRKYPDNTVSGKKVDDIKIGKSSVRGLDPETLDAQKSSVLHKDEKGLSRLNAKDGDKCHKPGTATATAENVHHNGSATLDSSSVESDEHRAEKKEKSKHKRLHRNEVASDDDGRFGSEIEDRKEAKRRRKEEKKVRKEEKRRRREERRRRREERCAEKLKSLSRYDTSSSDDEHVEKRVSHQSDDEEAESDPKKLEIELRKKALESLKAKKGIGH